MSVATTVGAYLGVGFLVTSALHTWYAGHVFDHLEFGLPFSPTYRVRRPVHYGYLGAVVVGLVVLAVSWAYVTFELSVGTATVGGVLRTKLTGYVLVLGVLVGVSQLVGGASWSKLVLEVVLGAMAFIVVVAHLDPPSFWNLFTIYAAVVPPLGAAWGVWREYYIETRVADGGGDAPDSVLYPHFPSFTYFVGASLYVLFFSLLLLVPTIQ